MTGNDIVDLEIAATESDWQRRGFTEKIFTSQEQQYIKEDISPGKMVWRLWTMKESAYKLYIREFSGRFFAPQKFGCTLVSDTSGIVDYQSHIYQTNTKATSNYVHTVAKNIQSENDKTIVKCFNLPIKQPGAQQEFIYRKIIDSYRPSSGDFNKEVSFSKCKNGIPFLYCGKNLQIPVSITHHGNFAAFTIY